MNEDVDWDELMEEHRSNQDELECPYCGQQFETDEESTAFHKESVHKASEHINPDENIEQPDQRRGKDTNKLDEYRRNAEREKGKGLGGKKA